MVPQVAQLMYFTSETPGVRGPAAGLAGGGGGGVRYDGLHQGHAAVLMPMTVMPSPKNLNTLSQSRRSIVPLSNRDRSHCLTWSSSLWRDSTYVSAGTLLPMLSSKMRGRQHMFRDSLCRRCSISGSKQQPTESRPPLCVLYSRWAICEQCLCHPLFILYDRLITPSSNQDEHYTRRGCAIASR